MSESVSIRDAATGQPTPIATDEATVDGEVARVQRVKPVHGPPGQAVDTSAATPMPVTDAQIAAVLVSLSNLQTELNQKLEAGQQIELGPAALAALEQVTVSIASGTTFDLSPASLAALESVTVSGSIDLSPASLSALETITAVVSGTVAVSNLPAVLDADGGLKVHVQNPSGGGGGSVTVATEQPIVNHFPNPGSVGDVNGNLSGSTFIWPRPDVTPTIFGSVHRDAWQDRTGRGAQSLYVTRYRATSTAPGQLLGVSAGSGNGLVIGGLRGTPSGRRIAFAVLVYVPEWGTPNALRLEASGHDGQSYVNAAYVDSAVPVAGRMIELVSWVDIPPGRAIESFALEPRTTMSAAGQTIEMAIADWRVMEIEPTVVTGREPAPEFFSGSSPGAYWEGTADRSRSMRPAGSDAVADLLRGRLPVQQTLTDAFTQPSVPGVAGLGMVWNGTSWERARKAITTTHASALTGIPVINPVMLNLAAEGGALGIRNSAGGDNQPGLYVLSTTSLVRNAGANFNQPRSAAAVGDGGAGDSMPAQGGYVFNGTAWDRMRSAASTEGSWSTGLVTVAALRRASDQTFRAQVVAADLADAAAGTNFGGSGGMLFNGTTWDRARSVAGSLAATGIGAVAGMLYDNFANSYKRPVQAGGTADAGNGDGDQRVHPVLFNGTTSYERARTGYADALSVGIPASGGMVFNGTTWDRVRSANSAEATAGAGLAGVGALLWNAAGSIWQRMQQVKADGGGLSNGAGVQAVGPVLFDPVAGNFVSQRLASRDAETGGLAGVGGMLFNGSTWDRAKAYPVGGGAINDGKGITATGLMAQDADDGSTAAFSIKSGPYYATSTIDPRATLAVTPVMAPPNSGGVHVPFQGDIANGLRTASDFKQVAKAEPLAGEELRFDDISGGDLYIGAAPDATATNVASWKVVRYYRTATGAITRSRYRTGVAWDSRTAGWS